MDAMDGEPGEGAPAGGNDGNELPGQIAQLVGDLTEDERPPSRRGLTALLRDAARGSARFMGRGMSATWRGAQSRGRWLADQVLAMAPRLPVRDLATLRAQLPGLSPDQIADALIEGAARASAAMGAGVGAWLAVPVVPAFPVLVATETLALVGIEIKLVAELHEVYGMRAPGHVVDRMTAYVAAWAHRRGVALAPGGVVLAIGSPLRLRLQRRLAGRATRSAFSLGPLMTGAVAGSLINRWETRRLGQDVRNDLRQRSPIAALRRG